MSDSTEIPHSSPRPVQTIQKPPGVLPKNAQTYVIVGIAVVMVGVIAFSGNGAPSGRKEGGRPPGVVDPNQQRIAEYRQRIDEQTRRLQEEQARLALAKQQLGPSSATSPSPGSSLPAAGSPPEPRPEKSAIEQEKEKREYLSLFASNVALTTRKEGASSGSGSSPAPLASPLSAASTPSSVLTSVTPGTAGPASLVPTAPSSVSPLPIERSLPTEPSVRPEPLEPLASAPRTGRRDYRELERAAGKSYRLFEGTMLETVLTNRLNGSFSGPVNCLVTTPVYSHDRQHLLIPQGARVLGEVQRNTTFGQQRLAVFFHRLLLPDGYSVSLDQFHGLNQIGETGLRDQVNHHYGQVFGVSLAIGAIAGLANVNTGYGLAGSSTDTYRQGVSASLSQSSLRILDRYLNVLPTFTIREGHRIKIYLSDDLLLPAYEQHTLPSNL